MATSTIVVAALMEDSILTSAPVSTASASAWRPWP
jgi:hypothetical protein